MIRGILALSLVCFAACGDDSGNGLDGGAGDGSHDQSATDDSGAHADLSGYDATCSLQTFGGFPGTSTQLRRLDCSCGCVIDPFTTTQVSGIWNGSLSNASF